VTARRPAAVAAVLLVLASLLGAHLAAVLLLAAVTAVCLALGVLAFAIAGVVVESGWRTVPGCAVLSTWREA
jgi:hypothetical protein